MSPATQQAASGIVREATCLDPPPASPPAARSRQALLRLRSDDALAERFRAGDELAFALLYERHRARAFAVALGVLGDHGDAEDATQEAFSSAAATLRGRPVRELRPWLARVARNAAIDLQRRRRTNACVATGSATALVDAIDGPRGADAEEVASGRRDMEQMLVALQRLPEPQRTALVMREVGGHSYAEIASALELDHGAVHGLIARARTIMRRDWHLLRALTPTPGLSSATTLAMHATRPAVVASLATRGFSGGVGAAVSRLATACLVSVCAVSGVVGGAAFLHHHGARPGAGARAHAVTAARRHATISSPSPSPSPSTLAPSLRAVEPAPPTGARFGSSRSPADSRSRHHGRAFAAQPDLSSGAGDATFGALPALPSQPPLSRWASPQSRPRPASALPPAFLKNAPSGSPATPKASTAPPASTPLRRPPAAQSPAVAPASPQRRPQPGNEPAPRQRPPNARRFPSYRQPRPHMRPGARLRPYPRYSGSFPSDAAPQPGSTTTETTVRPSTTYPSAGTAPAPLPTSTSPPPTSAGTTAGGSPTPTV